MAGLNGTITIQNSQYRPCIVKGKKALFHKWETKSEIIPPSPMVGGHGGGVACRDIGIVEYEDGTVHEAYPYEIQFVDNLASEYAFSQEANNKETI